MATASCAHRNNTINHPNPAPRYRRIQFENATIGIPTEPNPRTECPSIYSNTYSNMDKKATRDITGFLINHRFVDEEAADPPQHPHPH